MAIHHSAVDLSIKSQRDPDETRKERTGKKERRRTERPRAEQKARQQSERSSRETLSNNGIRAHVTLDPGNRDTLFVRKATSIRALRVPHTPRCSCNKKKMETRKRKRSLGPTIFHSIRTDPSDLAILFISLALLDYYFSDIYS